MKSVSEKYRGKRVRFANESDYKEFMRLLENEGIYKWANGDEEPTEWCPLKKLKSWSTELSVKTINICLNNSNKLTWGEGTENTICYDKNEDECKPCFTFREVIARIKNGETYTDGNKTISCDNLGDIEVKYRCKHDKWLFCEEIEYTLVEQPKEKVYEVEGFINPPSCLNEEDIIRFNVGEFTYNNLISKLKDKGRVFLSVKFADGKRDYIRVKGLRKLELTPEQIKENYKKNIQITCVW